jgi:regulator of protease activity HflC (stomatin/prohibitin superfamily)
MLFVKYLLITGGVGLLLTAAGIVIWDLYIIFRPRPLSLAGDEAELPGSGNSPLSSLRWRSAARLAAFALIPLLLGISIAVVPGGKAGVRVSQFGGALPGTLYPGVHWITPLVEHVELFNIRDRVFTTSLADDPKKKVDTLRVQTKEGLGVVLAVTVRFKLDPSKLSYIYSNLPQPVEEEIVPPTVSSAFREAAPNYTVREIFATRRDEMARAVAAQITRRLASDGVIVKEIMLRDIQLPAEYAKGMEGLLLKEQENERLSVELEVKQKMVREAELEADAQKAREVKAAEARAQVVVIEAKAQADAMQHTLPLKEKQIQQSRLEAEARKASTVMNAEAMAQAKVIDSKAQDDHRRRVRSHPPRRRSRCRADEAGSRGAEGESTADPEDHRREAFRQSANHDGPERRKILLRQRCA